MLYVIVWNTLIKDKQVYLLEKKFKDDIEYTFVGDHVETGESIKAAIIRETFEEVNVIVKEKDLEFICTIDRVRESGEHKIHFFFKCTSWQNNPYNREENKHLLGDWFPLDNLPFKLCAIGQIAIGSFKSKQ